MIPVRIAKLSIKPNHYNSRRSFSTSRKYFTKIVIVGGVAGGATAAARARRIDEKADIVIYEKGEDVSFANCGLPYYIGGEITNRHALALHTPSSLGNLLNISPQTRKEVTRIDREKKLVEVLDLQSGKKEESKYDKLLLSTGAAPFRPPLPGVDLKNVFTLRTLQDMDLIFQKVPNSKSAIVVGAGFIGLEMVEALVHRGLNVTLVEFKDHVLPILDFEMTNLMLSELSSNGVQVHLNERITKFEDKNGKVEATLGSGNAPLTADFVILSTGVVPESKLAVDAGLDVNPRNKTIIVNEYMQTSDPDIYAVGDAVQSVDQLFKQPSWVPLAGPANRQGRIAAEHMLTGNPETKYRGNIGTSIVRVFDQIAASTGHTEQSLKMMNKSFETVTVTGHNHAGYYPGATPIILKVIWDKETRKILGAQANGVDGVDKRIDVIATAIGAGMTVDDLAHLELTYSPPFGSARDVINTAGFAALNMKNKLLLPARSLTEDDQSLILDVREKEISTLHPIPNASNIPLSQLRDRLNEIQDKNRSITTVCALGKSSYFASRILNQNGFTAKSLLGGVSLLNLPSTTPPPPPSSATNKHANAVQTNNDEVVLDACGLACPGPILAIRKKLPELKKEQVLVVKSSDSGFMNDFPAFCKANNLKCIEVQKSKGIITGKLQITDSPQQTQQLTTPNTNKDIAIVVFSGDLDKVLAAMIIANGTVAMGGSATLFFTFWGLNALRTNSTHLKEGEKEPQKTLMEKMMGMMMPRGVDNLTLSQMNFGGIGTKMMKDTMAKKNLPNLPDLMKEAKDSGKVRFVACTMSMDALSISSSELVEYCEYGGVADFLSASSNAKSTLFI